MALFNFQEDGKKAERFIVYVYFCTREPNYRKFKNDKLYVNTFLF